MALQCSIPPRIPGWRLYSISHPTQKSLFVDKNDVPHIECADGINITEGEHTDLEVGNCTENTTIVDQSINDITTTTATTNRSIEISIDPEIFRFTGYMCFWTMVLICIIITKTSITLPDPTPLVKNFGYNNICIYFDLDPARIVASMLYPLVEYFMVIYIVTNWYVGKDTFLLQGNMTFISFTIVSCIEIILIAWVRMIFVIQSSDDIKGHTLPFLGLQIALAMIAAQNTIYYNILHDSDVDWKHCKCNHSIQAYLSIFGWVYTFLLFAVTSIKIIFTAAILSGHPLMTTGSDIQVAVGTTFDYGWMILAAVIPVFLSLYAIFDQDRPKLTTSFSLNIRRNSIAKKV